MAYQQSKGRFLVISPINSEKNKLIAKITCEHPLEVITEDNTRPLSKMDFRVHNELTAKIQEKGLKNFLEQEKMSGNNYPARLKEVIELSPKIEIPVFKIEVKNSNVVEPIIIKEVIAEQTTDPKEDKIVASPDEVLPANEEIIETTSENLEEITTQKNLPTEDMTPEQEDQTPSTKTKVEKNPFNKKILGNLYFDMYFALQRETKMKVASDFTIQYKTPKFVFVPSKSLGKTTEARMTLAWDFFKKHYNQNAESPYFTIALPDTMPSDVLSLDLTLQYEKLLEEIMEPA